MNNYAAWELWVHDNVVVVLLLVSLLFSFMIWASLKMFAQQKEITAQKKLVEDSEIAKLCIQIKELVTHIKVLFRKHDDHEERITALETKIAGHFTKCGEREKTLLDIKYRQDANIAKFDDALLGLSGGHRKYDKPTNRSERTD